MRKASNEETTASDVLCHCGWNAQGLW